MLRIDWHDGMGSGCQLVAITDIDLQAQFARFGLKTQRGQCSIDRIGSAA